MTSASLFHRHLLRRSGAPFGAGVVAFVLMLACATGLEACSGEGVDTGGKRVVLHTRVELAAPTSFTNAFGWSVELDRVLMATGAFYYFDAPPPVVAQAPAAPVDWAGRLLGLGTAHAHPGHYEAGSALGEMTVPFSVDLLAGAADYPDGAGVTGIYRTARFSFSEAPAGPVADGLEGHAVLAEGSAEKAGEAPRYFRIFADHAEVARSASGGSIDGCELGEASVNSDGTIYVAVDPEPWFELVDFSELAPGTPAAPSEAEAQSQPRIAFAQGLAALSAYRFSYVPAAP
jgi:hypothetical protein